MINLHQSGRRRPPAWAWLPMCCLWLAALPQGDRERGLALYAEGQFAAAAQAFRAALQSEGDSPELQYNLALACWRAGELEAAELAAEKYAATARHPRPELHRGLLGAVRHAEALALQAAAQSSLQTPPGPDAPAGADPLQGLQAALAKAEQARDYFVRGAVDGNSAELRRNTERTLRLIEELQRQIEERKQQSQPSSDDAKDNEENKDSKDKQDSQDSKEKQDSKDKQDQAGQPGEKSESDEKSGQPEKPEKPEKPANSDAKSDPGQAPKSEPQKGSQDPSSPAGQQPPKPPEDPGQSAGEAQPPEPQPQQPPEQPSAGKEGQSKDPSKPPPADPASTGDTGKDPAGEFGTESPPAKSATPRQDAPGEQRPGRELTQEQEQRLLEALRDGEQKLREMRLRATRAARRAAEQDW